MLKQEIVYIPTKDLTEFEQPLVDGLSDFITKTKGYFFTQEELKKLLEDTYFEGECFGIGTDGCINKQDYINKLLNQ